MSHKTEAERLLANIESGELWEQDARFDLDAANAKATLALVEAQEAANELKRIEVLLATGYNFAKELFEDTGHPYLDSTAPVFKPHIAAALGIGETNV